MIHLFFKLYFVFSSCVVVLISASSTHLPRMIFTNRETANMAHLHGDLTSIRILPEGQRDLIIAAGQKLYVFNSQNFDKAPVQRRVFGKECVDGGDTSGDCDYNITVLHKTEKANMLYLCGTNMRQTVCCHMSISDNSSDCSNSKVTRDFIAKEGEPSALVASAGGADLYITYSGSQVNVGIHKYGEKRVTPASHGKEQHYVGLVLSRWRENPLQDKVYAFYKERNADTGLDGDMWLPFVSQVCMADTGGSKTYLQFRWTSKMSARLFCGDSASRQHYSELVDVAAAHAKQRDHTKVYALFRNEWGMSAVCVYTIADIEAIFTNSPFKGPSVDSQSTRSRACVKESMAIPLVTLTAIAKNSEMEEWIRPLSNSGPLLVSHHHYTHICVDSFQDENNRRTVLFLALQKGVVHKMVEKRTEAFFIGEYRPFAHRAHILSMTFHPSTRKLYVGSSSEVVQLDVGNCVHYGDSCEDCIIARDPYCGWNGTHCSPRTNQTLQDVEQGNHSICTSRVRLSQIVFSTPSSVRDGDEPVSSVTLPLRSKYFLQCPVLSHHAEYTWHHRETVSACVPEKEQCLLLIDSFGPNDVGTYWCVMEELGYRKTLAQYDLQLENGADGRPSRTLVWVCLLGVVIKSGSAECSL